MLDDLVSDLRFALRTMARNPGFTVVVLTLALGIGANTAIFTLMDQVLLRVLPVKDPERLVVLEAPGPKGAFVIRPTTGPIQALPLLTGVLRSDGGRTEFALEGTVNGAGSALECLAAESYSSNIGYEGTTMPWITFYAAILRPSFPLILFIAFAWIYTLINLAQTYVFYCSRILFAWSFDRLIPSAFAIFTPSCAARSSPS